jgi:hypothetical protein
MFTTTRIRRLAVLGALACSLFAPGVAAARPIDEARLATARQQERYYASFPALDTHPQGQYYASYGQPEPIAAAQVPAQADDTPWLPVALAIAAALATAGVGVTQRRRLRIRRRPTRATT